ncbi:uncharacterized protein TNCV_7171 [Trichonephila clavipes]|nr:uncharacterized protein TNCV_7171 [Trichonephila clavipes]
MFLNNNNDLPQFRKKVRTEEKVMPSTSGYNLRPSRGVKGKSRPTNEKMTQQKADQLEQGNREHQYNPYIEEQAISSSRGIPERRSVQQQHCQERKGGANSNKSISLEV